MDIIQIGQNLPAPSHITNEDNIKVNVKDKYHDLYETKINIGKDRETELSLLFGNNSFLKFEIDNKEIYFNNDGEKLRKDQAKIIKEIDPLLNCSYRLLFLRSLAHYIKNKNDIPTFNESVDYAGIPRHTVSISQDSLEDHGIIAGIRHHKKVKIIHEGKEVDGISSHAFAMYVEATHFVNDIISTEELIRAYHEADKKAFKYPCEKDRMSELEAIAGK